MNKKQPLEVECITDKGNLSTICELLYVPLGWQLDDVQIEQQNKEYEAYTFQLNTSYIQFRTAKITPTKTGQFVTIWKRDEGGSSQPYDVTDRVDLFVIHVKQGDRLGQFVFPKSMMCQRDIVSTNRKGGKRGIRVYPPWDTPMSKQAEKTQEWQLKYFLEMTNLKTINYKRAEELYSPKLNRG